MQADQKWVRQANLNANCEQPTSAVTALVGWSQFAFKLAWLQLRLNSNRWHYCDQQRLVWCSFHDVRETMNESLHLMIIFPIHLQWLHFSIHAFLLDEWRLKSYQKLYQLLLHKMLNNKSARKQNMHAAVCCHLKMMSVQCKLSNKENILKTFKLMHIHTDIHRQFATITLLIQWNRQLVMQQENVSNVLGSCNVCKQQTFGTLCEQSVPVCLCTAPKWV